MNKPKKELTLEQEEFLVETYFFYKERGFQESDQPTIDAYKALLKSIQKRFIESGLKHKAPSKNMGISVVTLWRRFKKNNWKKNELVILLRLIHKI